jgi:hypothetical protein
MNTTPSVEKPEPFLTKRHLGWASVAAVCGCVGASSVPFLAVAVGGGATATAIASFFRPGSEVVVGGLVFAATLGIMAFRARSSAARVCAVPRS